MTAAIAGGLLQYGAMPAGAAKDDVELVAHVLANSFSDMSPPIALGSAYLLKTSTPLMFARLARQAAANEQETH